MFDALYISATGMQAQQLNVDTIANNLANVNTTGFKKSKISFTDLMVREAGRTAPSLEEAGILGGGSRLGAGVGIASTSKLFDMGDLKKTESAFDIAIQGEGFLEVTMPDGSSAYTRGGTFKVNRDGLLATSGGFPLKPNLAIPDNAQNMQIDSDGRVRIQVAGQATPVEIGQLELVRFTSPTGLMAQGDNLYRSSSNSGEAISGKAAEDGMGNLAQGFLEGSNVKLTEEMVSLMVAQRVYEANVKVMQASDEMLGMINGLRK
ncbi:flagellar basal-body rod protein FlgG [Variovorax boronicumulans]|uniref:flagellar basal-body rod protein FlgG n=1 Tax=Variovorax boronicumulans TaxID=436515 RepID=UPI0027841A7E|nr:flagellar basal-body rod protein FlgG [Variovorax boronicumulans]MDP9992370.1 flagellar basal-body rod protein FlgG [Variovorax boronicumulans]MDQ0002458.1 flagellar basal-body rod protein FlgG [Variovorax boronicumulans]